MKYDLSKKMTRGAKRTLESFSKTMFTLLSKKPFENISVNEICEVSNFPRATFYNYFDDKYDLLNYCWYLISSEINIEEHTSIPSEEVINVLFDRLYNLFNKHSELLAKILKNNPSNSPLLNHYHSYLKHTMQMVFNECLDIGNKNVPLEIIAVHFSNTLLIILEATFFSPEPISLEEAHKYLNYLLGHLLK